MNALVLLAADFYGAPFVPRKNNPQVLISKPSNTFHPTLKVYFPVLCVIRTTYLLPRPLSPKYPAGFITRKYLHAGRMSFAVQKSQQQI